MIDLARIYRCCDLKTLARDLGRDPTRLIPDTGNPKLDLMAGLARNLDWTIPEVIRALTGRIVTEEVVAEDPAGVGLPALDALWMQACHAGKHREMLDIAALMCRRASSTREHQLACMRMYGAYEATGWYVPALECLHEGLSRSGGDPEIRNLLLANLGNAHYALGNLVEASAIATEVIETVHPGNRLTRATTAFARYVRGHALRRSASRNEEDWTRCARKALRDLGDARRTYRQLAAERANPQHEAIAATCEGGEVELGAGLGRINPDAAVRMLWDGSVDREHGDALESSGWRTVFAANVASRHLEGKRLLETLGRSSIRLERIAGDLGHWGFRARAASIELARRDHARSQAIQLEPWVLDAARLRNLIRTMGRMPEFRATGWRILLEHGVLKGAMKRGRASISRKTRTSTEVMDGNPADLRKVGPAP